MGMPVDAPHVTRGSQSRAFVLDPGALVRPPTSNPIASLEHACAEPTAFSVGWSIEETICLSAVRADAA